MGESDPNRLLNVVVDRLEVGIFAVDAEMRIVLWNHFMAMHSGRRAEEVVGRKLFECFAELPAKWLEKKIRNVFLLKNYAFTSWEQRPYLFRFNHNRPITGGVDAMQQNCTFLPVRNADDVVEQVCITLFDTTDTAIYQLRLTRAIDELDKEKEAQQRLIVQLEEAQVTLERLATRDGLTGLANRRFFDETLNTEWRRAMRESTPLSLLMLDVDFFKRYNDAYGHQKGDACLQFVACAMMGEMLRASDLAARYGGEEFVVILPTTTLQGATVVGERVRAAVARLGMPHSASDVAEYVSASIGVATVVPTPRSTPAQLIAAADAALYRAKREGRNRVVATLADCAEQLV